MTPAAREALIRRLHRQFAEMAQDDPDETPGYQPRQMAERRPFYMADQMEADDVSTC
jgi:hypothetical protein